MPGIPGRRNSFKSKDMAQDFNIEIKGMDELQKALKHYPSISEPILQRAIEASQAQLAKNTKGSRGDRSMPVPVRSSNLLHSFRAQAGRLWARWYPTAPYASMVHDGTGIYGPEKKMIIVKPKNKKALFWPGAKHPVRSVKQKGFKGNPFMPKILDMSKKEIDAIFVRALDKVSEEITSFR